VDLRPDRRLCIGVVEVRALQYIQGLVLTNGGLGGRMDYWQEDPAMLSGFRFDKPDRSFDSQWFSG
jgi:hypothetical protein